VSLGCKGVQINHCWLVYYGYHIVVKHHAIHIMFCNLIRLIKFRVDLLPVFSCQCVCVVYEFSILQSELAYLFMMP
jgi:hypothetical protein